MGILVGQRDLKFEGINIIHMNRYYPNSLPFRWLRKKLNIQKPLALPWGEWNDWEKNLQTQRPVAFWLTQTLPEWLEKPAELTIDPLNEFKYYLKNRFIDKTHYLRTGLKPGEWHDFDTRMLHGLFTELVDFVEIEKAHMQAIWSEQKNQQKYQMPWWRKSHWFRWGRWRCPQAGLDYLNWEVTLKKDADWFNDPNHPDIGQPTDQSLAAREILALYHWWVYQRTQRPDVQDASGWSAICDEIRAKYQDVFAEVTDEDLQARQDQALDRWHEIEQQYEKEDTEMLIRLINIRKSLWT